MFKQSPPVRFPNPIGRGLETVLEAAADGIHVYLLELVGDAATPKKRGGET